MDTITSFISNLFSLVSFIHTQYLIPLLSLYPRNNTITTTDDEQLSQRTADCTRHSTIIQILEEQQASNPLNKSSEGQEDQLKKTKEVALTVALSIAAISAALVINPLVPRNLHFLLTPYMYLLYGGLFISVGLAIYSVKNNSRTSSARRNNGAQAAWVLRMLVLLGIISIFLAVVLRGLMAQSIH